MDDPPGAEEYYTALGRAFVLWGHMDSHFTELLDILCAAPSVRHLRPAEMPISLKQRIQLCKQLLKKAPDLDNFRGPLGKLLPAIKDAADDRNILVHGHWNGFVIEQPLTGAFAIKRRKGDRYLMGRQLVTLNDLNKMAVTFDSLNTRLLPLTFASVRLHPIPEADKARLPEV